MNPLTNIKNIQKLNQRELELGINIKQSWHQQYKDSAWVFIGGLSYDLTEGDVICVFSQYGEIININLVRDRKTGKSKGFAFLCYEDQRSTILAVDNLNGMKLTQRTIRVDHVEEYKVPKMDEDMDETQKQLALEGVAPKVIQPPPQLDNDSDEGLLQPPRPPPLADKTKSKKQKKVKVKKEKEKRKKKKRKHSTSSESSSSSSDSDSTASSDSDNNRKKKRSKKKRNKIKQEYNDSDEIKKEKRDTGYEKYENPNKNDRWQHDKYREVNRDYDRARKIKNEYDMDENIRDRSRNNLDKYRTDRSSERQRSRSRERQRHRSKDNGRERHKEKYLERR